MYNPVRKHPAAIVALLGIVSQLAHADTLLVDRVKQEQTLAAPVRGMSMNQVEKKFGAPAQKMSPAGGDSAKHPVINRWAYDNFIVYFERDRVITAVAKHTSATEIGPKGTQ